MPKVVAKTKGITFIPSDRSVVNGVKKGDCRPSRSGGSNFRRLGGGHGAYTMPSQLWVYVVHRGGRDNQIDVASLFREKFDGKLTAKRVKAIKDSVPETLDLEFDGERWVVTDESLDSWFLLAQDKMRVK